MAAAAPKLTVPEAPRFELAPFSYAEARTLAHELGLAEPVAVTLVRRGYRTPDQARAFLDGSERHSPFEFDGMQAVADRLRVAIDAGRRITVHGDYDADGVCSTAILVGTLRALGAHCDWHIPDRLGEGYGLTAAGVEALRARGTDLLLTADCGITCAPEVAAARGSGMEVIVTDHHQPEGELPDCPILHPQLSGYPCQELCATGVAYKLAAALRGAEADAELDLVALATVADLVPLKGENRALVRAGLRRARTSPRAGLRALMESAGVEPERLDEGDLAFRLAPRINAAGRLYRADGGVELMLTDDPHRAAAIAAELERANYERRETERTVLDGAERAHRELGPELAEAPALVVAGEGWHPGVVGICASRMVERHGRPVVLIALDEHGRGRGSGRSVPGFDLLGGLRACGDHLTRFGGHQAAAGLEIEAERIPAFREAFVAYATERLGSEPPARVEPVDAVAGAEELGLEVAQQLAQLAPFGKGNPRVRLVVPAARVRDVRPMGEGERHARFSLEGAAGRARGVAFGVNGELSAAAEAQALDVSVSLEVNHWNGAVEPRVVLGSLYPGPDGAGTTGEAPVPSDGQWWARLSEELDRPLRPWPEERLPFAAADSQRTMVDRRGRSGVATVAALASSGESVLVVCADAVRRRALVERAAVPARFGGGQVALAAGALCDEAVAVEAATIAREGGVALADWARLARDPAMARNFAHVVVIDPPPFAHLEGLVNRGGDGGHLHIAWGPAEIEMAHRCHEAEWPARPALAALYRGLSQACGESSFIAGADVRVALAAGTGRQPSPECLARSLRVLMDLGVVAWAEASHGSGSANPRALGVVSSEASELTRSEAYVAYRERYEEGRRYLSGRRQPE